MHLLFVRMASEVAIKSRRTKKQFLQLLHRNMRDALKQTGSIFELQQKWNRFEVRVEDAEVSIETLRRVFGVGSIALVEAISSSHLEDILRTGADHFADAVAEKRFAVRVKRRGVHPYSSQDVERQLGAALYPFAAGVDLTHPEITVRVEIEDERAYFYTRRITGHGGLPVSSQGRALSLISGGYDSAVSSWLLLKRGVELDYVFFNLAGGAYERTVLQVAKVLADRWSYGTQPTIYVVDFGEVVDEIRRSTKQSYWQVLLKRLMYRAAEKIARKQGHDALITGESMGQVSSQTLKNLRAIDAVAELPVLRPLLGYDKTEIIHLARRIGTAGISEKVKEYCAIAPGNPITAARVEAVDIQESHIRMEVLDAALAHTRALKLRDLSYADLVLPYVFIDRIPERALVVDLRDQQAYEMWHYPSAVRMDPWHAKERLSKTDVPVVLYCEQGVQSAQLAEELQTAGVEAYSYRGGAPRLRKVYESTEDRNLLGSANA